MLFSVLDESFQCDRGTSFALLHPFWCGTWKVQGGTGVSDGIPTVTQRLTGCWLSMLTVSRVGDLVCGSEGKTMPNIACLGNGRVLGAFIHHAKHCTFSKHIFEIHILSWWVFVLAIPNNTHCWGILGIRILVRRVFAYVHHAGSGNSIQLICAIGKQ